MLREACSYFFFMSFLVGFGVNVPFPLGHLDWIHLKQLA